MNDFNDVLSLISLKFQLQMHAIAYENICRFFFVSWKKNFLNLLNDLFHRA